MILSRILGSCAPSILVAVFEKAWKEKMMGQWSNYSGMTLKEMLLNPSKLSPKQKTNVEAGNLCAFDVSLFALVLVHDPGCKGLLGKNQEVVKAILELARLRNEWSHDRQLSQTLTEGEYYDLWQQADKNLNVLAGWAGSETMQLLQRTMNEILQEVISDQAHKVPQHDFSNGAGSHLHGALVTSLTCNITCAPHYQAWRDSQKTKETNAQKRERYLLLYPAVGGEGEVGRGGLGGGHQQQRKKARTTAKTANEQPPKLATEAFLWRPCRGTSHRPTILAKPSLKPSIYVCTYCHMCADSSDIPVHEALS
jgi:hypothetical protein